MRVAAALVLLSSASGFAPPRSPLLSAPLLRNAAVRKFAPVAVASADDAPPADTSPLPPSAASPSGVLDAADAVYRFSRPHTIRGTLLACFTGVGRALIEAPEYLPLLLPLLPRALLGVLALLLGNLFIVGINQIYDVEIDEVNKPFLPVAAGRISPRVAWALVLAAGAGGLAVVRATFSPLIQVLFAFGTAVGALYSVPPFQLKRFPVAAGITIATCRGFLLNFGTPRTEHSHTRAARPCASSHARSPLFAGVYYATREALGLSFVWSAPVAFLARFMTVYAAVIAVTKDLPDVAGDIKGGIDTFASRLGVRKVANGASAALALNYAAAVATACLAPAGAFRRWLMAGGHLLAAGWLFKAWKELDANAGSGKEVGLQPDQGAIKEYYKQIWNLFYFEYLMYPFI